MTPSRLAEIEARAKAMIEGPHRKTMAVILRQDIPDLIAEVKRLKQERDMARAKTLPLMTEIFGSG